MTTHDTAYESNGSPGRVALSITLCTTCILFWWYVVDLAVSSDVSGLIGTGIGVAFVGYILSASLVSVPEVTGLLTVNSVTGQLRPYSTGIHFRYPWEQVRAENYIDLSVVTNRYEETFPSADGPIIKVRWSLQYQPVLDRLSRFILLDESTISEGFHDVGSSFLSSVVAKTSAMELKLRQKEILEKPLIEYFKSHDAIGLVDGQTSLEDFYGVHLVTASIADVDYEDVFQRARTSEQVAIRLRDIARRIRDEHPEVTQKEAMNYALIVNGNVKKSIQEVEGEAGKALAALLMAMSRGE